MKKENRLFNKFGLINILNILNLKKLNNIVKRANKNSNKVSKFTDKELRDEFQQYKNKYIDLRSNNEVLASILSIIGEVIYRTLKIRPYKEQYVCALAMYFNYIVEMKSGEGKSISAVIASILYSFECKVHIVTVNDYLAERDYKKSKDIFNILGLSVDVNLRLKQNKERLYETDIIYSSSMELIFDYLRNGLLPQEKKYKIQLQAVIIDEIDFVLLDNANSNFSISTGLNYKPKPDVFLMAKELCSLFKGHELIKDEFYISEEEPQDVHYLYSYNNSTVYLTDMGISVLENFLKINFKLQKNLKLYKIIINTLEANLFFLNGRDYIVKDNRIILINRINGRVIPDSHLEADLHTAIEIKEGVEISETALLCNSLSYQLFFSKYKHITGMSGTIYDAREEFERIFQVPIIIVPMRMLDKRIDYQDVFFKTNKEKYNYLIYYLKFLRKSNQPILIITNSEQESFEVYKLLKDNEIYSNLLNNQKPYEEAQLVVEAGVHGTITVSTNMSGRGTDIILDDEAKQAGGLLVIGLSRHLSKRIDNQIRGRSGRQGDIGECIFYISLEDEIWHQLNKKQQKKVNKLINNVSKKTTLKLSKFLDKVQNKYQVEHFKQRQINYLLDMVIEKQRNIIFDWKGDIKNNSKDVIIKYIINGSINLEHFYKTFTNGQSIDILEEMDKQYKQLGEEISALLINQLIDNIVYKYWLIYKKDMEGIKIYLPQYRLPEESMLSEYIKLCFEELEILQKDIICNIVGYFISAEIENSTN